MPAQPIENISTVSMTLEMIPQILRLSPTSYDPAISGIRSPAKEAVIAEGKSTRGNTILLTVPYAANELSRELPLFCNPIGIRTCSMVTSAERMYALKASGNAFEHRRLNDCCFSLLLIFKLIIVK